MNPRGVLFLLGRVMLAISVALCVPSALAWYENGPDFSALVTAAVVAGVIGLVSQRLFHQSREFTFGRRDAFVLVAAAWVTASLTGALPYVLYKGPSFIIDGIFEAVSGFTTTGATILTDIEAEPRGLLLWRSLTQWLGGMGIIVLGIAILPKLAVGGMDLLGAEAPGPIQEKLTPRIAQTAKLLWGLYALLTAAETLVLILLGLTPFDAVNHAMTTTATAGFSVLNDSVGGYGSAAIEVTIIFFMMLAGANFALHYQVVRGKGMALFRDPEFRVYLIVLAAATLLITVSLAFSDAVGNWLEALRRAGFQVVAIVTTTGYTTADYDAWPHFPRMLLFLLVFVGGCAGSTGGSVKVVRLMIVAKKLVVDLRRMVRPHAVIPVRLGDRSIPDDVVARVTNFVLLFLLLFAAGGLVLAYLGVDMVSAFSASASCISNVGPGFGLVGPTQNFAAIPQLGKLVLAALMLTGRLEIYTVLVLLFLTRRALP